MKANQITAIGVSIIALGVIIAGGIYVNKEREQTIIKKEQETRNIYYSCMSSVTTIGETYTLQRKLGRFEESRKTLERCLSRYGITEPDEYLIRQFQY